MWTGNDHRPALDNKAAGRRQTDAAVATHDQRDLSFKSHSPPFPDMA